MGSALIRGVKVKELGFRYIGVGRGEPWDQR